MLGWELPPLITGGLGTACGGLLRALKRQGVDIVFVVARAVQGLTYNGADVMAALETVPASDLAGYGRASPLSGYTSGYGGGLYRDDILDEVTQYAEVVRQLSSEQHFDIVHAHDWTTYRAGVLAREVLGRPLVAHVHSIEHDRAPGSPDARLCALEKEGLLAGNRVIAVSRYTRRRILESYGIDSRKVRVIHNGVDTDAPPSTRVGPSEHRPKTVLFAGRLTAQKGPQYFLLAAERVLKSAPDTRFVIAGDGDERSHLERMTEELGIEDRVLFTGFLSQFDLDRVYSLASVCVMTSVSEPFGLVALEAMRRGIPVIVPKQAGVTEVVRYCLRVDYRNVDGIAAKVLALIDDRKHLGSVLAGNAMHEVANVTWREAARKLIKIYCGLSAQGQRRCPRAGRPLRD